MSSFLNLSLFFVLILAASAAEPKPRSFLLPIRKDVRKLQYYTSLGVGTPSNPVDAVIDLGTGLLWFDCESSFTTSSYKPVPCSSQKCELAKTAGGCIVGCNGAVRPGCTNNTCSVSSFNPYIGRLYDDGLYEDILHLGSTQVPNFPFICVDKGQIEGLASGAEGMLGLSRLPTALHTQISNAFNVPPKFSLCLPSSGLGRLSFGVDAKDTSKLLISTPLIINPKSTGPIIVAGQDSEEYFIDVKAIKISGKAISFNPSLLTIDRNGNGGTKLSTLTNFTVLHTSIFRAVVNEFANKASSMRITRVAPVPPFGACFSSKTIKSTKTGPAVPEIELVLPGRRGPVSWKIYGANSMVRVNQNVMCLGFVDGGSKSTSIVPLASIVIGGHQLEDNLLEFDLSTSTLKFSSSLLAHDASCSRY